MHIEIERVDIKQVYNQADAKDGFRILVDRLWPRGLSKDKAKVDLWLKSIAPSHELRTWYGHDPDKWPEFKQRYFTELDTNNEAVNELLSHVQHGKVSLLYSSKEAHFNNAAALRDYLCKMAGQH